MRTGILNFNNSHDRGKSNQKFYIMCRFLDSQVQRSLHRLKSLVYTLVEWLQNVRKHCVDRRSVDLISRGEIRHRVIHNIVGTIA